ncbi:MAG: glycosyltransferase family 4 protein [Rhodospirillales bacterium]|nr:MAG: glycosyltransferase family 4 protein [Rhodospirillales bacterium]
MPDAERKRYRLACLVTHPIQYQAPLFRRIAADPEIAFKAFFATDFSARDYVDPEFGQSIAWDVPLLDGYESEVLPRLPGSGYPGDTYFDAWRPFSTGLRSRLRAGGFDALWVHGYARAPHVWAMMAARMAGAKVLLRDETSDAGRPRAGARQVVKRLLFRGIDPLVDAYLTIGTANEEHLERLGVDRRKFFRMGYAVDNLWFRARMDEAAATRESLRAELDVAPGRPIALYAAKLIDRKAPLDLVEAFARAVDGAADGAGPALLMAGDGDLRPAVEARIAALGVGERIRLLGFQSQRRLAALYDLCDVFALPSERETWGLVVNEVMNAGRAVVASDRVGAARDLVRHGVTGYVHPHGDVEALAARLRDCFADPARLAEMGRAGRAVIEAWDFEADVAGLKAALAAVVKPR